ncbi:hypothetical protein [Streptomyces sp. NPDC058953]|uniref:hypothetical protein n=1 Tax=unclassified Streptomyces TaxID=2593676 RepID=UPI003678EF5E
MPSTAETGAWVQFKNKVTTGQCLEWTPLGAKWQPQKPFNNPSQRWILLGLDNDQYFIMGPGGALLTVRDDRGDVPVGEYNAGWRGLTLADPYQGSDLTAARRQIFLVRSSGSGFYTIASADGRVVLAPVDGALVRMVPPNSPAVANGCSQWSLEAVGKYSSLSDAQLLPITTAVNQPPEMYDYARPNPDRTPEVLLGLTTLPFPLVDDPRYPGHAGQSSRVPLYALLRYGLYKVGYYYDSSGASSRTETQEVKVGLTSTNAQEIERTTGISVTSEAGFAFKGLSASVSTTYSQQLRVLTSTSTTQSSEKTLTVQRTFEQGYRSAIAIWYRTDRYVLKRLEATGSFSAASTVLEWETTLQNDTVERSYAPNRPR